MTEFFNQFHFLRPLWLLMLIPSLLIVFRLWHQHHAHGSWQKVIAPELLQHLLHEKAQRTNRLPLVLLLVGWIVTCFALAGPTWQKMPIPVSKSQQPLVVVVDLSYYMMAADLKPDRLTRTRYKLQDLFRIRKDGVSAIVAYAGSAHIVAPLTDDSRTLANLTKAINPGIMPVQGNKPAEGIAQAKQLLERGSNESGDILLMTGNLSTEQAARIHDLLENTDIRLSVLGTGTEQGAPIPLPDGGYLKNRQGTIVIPQLDRDALRELAQNNGGQYRDMTVNDADLKALLPKASVNDDVMIVERDFDQWHDAGYWLLLPMLLLGLAGFRRGWLLAVMLCILLPATPEAQAFEWQDLWSTADQQGQQALQNKDAATAAQRFQNPQWKGEALFQNGQYEEAAKEFAKANTADSFYNKGNALAKAGKLQEALDAYDQALKQQPEFKNAQANRKLVEDLLKQQDQKNKDQQDQDQQKKDQQDKDKQNQQNQDESSSDEQQSDQQQSNDEKQEQQQNQQQNSKEQQNKEQQEQQKSEAEKKEQQAQQQQQEEQEQPAEEKPAEPQTQIEQDDSVQSLEKQALESWLRTIPDDPGGLLRRKFLQQQQQRQEQN